jgi:hypothetical protein
MRRSPSRVRPRRGSGRRRRLRRRRARPSSCTWSMRTSTCSERPNVTTFALVLPAMVATARSSALRIAVPPAGRASTNSPFARATPSSPPTRSVCAAATPVTTPMSGRATAQRRAISPSPRMPNSTTSTSVSSGAATIVTGSPCSLLKLRSLAATRRSAATAAATRSLVLVLPTLPVIPTTVAGRRVRAQLASAMSASPVSATPIAATGDDGVAAGTGRLVR